MFDEAEASALKDAFRLALSLLAMTHEIDEHLKARLADLVLKVYMTDRIPVQRDRVDITTLAARSVERYLTFHNFEQISEGVTLH